MKLAIPLFSFLLISNLVMSQTTDNPLLTYDDKGQLTLTVEGATHFAKLALKCIDQEYPNKLNQTLQDATYLKSPKELHPAFFGCFDWHSAVHGTWMLLRLMKSYPELPESNQIREVLNRKLTAENLAIEAAYFDMGGTKSWERMYGWSWLLKLAEEVHTWDDPDGRKIDKNLQPLTQKIIDRYIEFLPKQTYPVRTGVHPNTAFGLSYALDFANTTDHHELKSLIEQRAKDYYLEDTNCPANWEPSGEDFLSPCLEEANLMRRILKGKTFEVWYKKFLPNKKLDALIEPASVSDRTDGKIVHLDGLNLSRAWCLYGLANSITSKSRKAKLLEMANRHIEITLPNIADGNYEGEHWLASFAVYALSAR
ncbi:MAG: DUF2891 domain-containing protein [Bacteroidota bacterium]